MLLFLCSSLAQDAHFTQYYQTPSMVNPALSGTFNGLYRVGFNYRDQWRASVGRPFASFSAGGDVRFANSDRQASDITAIGINFFSDRTKQYDFSTTQIALSGAYHKVLEKKNNQYLGIAAQVSISQRNLNYEYLTFNDQFNAIDGYTFETAEALPVNNFGFFDLALGINYSMMPKKGNALNIGAAVFHILKPDISFYNKTKLPGQNEDLSFKLRQRLTVHASYAINTAEFFSIEPRVLYMAQGPYQEVMLSNLFKYKIPGGEGKTFFAGPGVRGVNNNDGFGIESIIAIIGMEYKGLILGLSYDHNLNDLINDNLGLNTFEFSINYLGEYENADAFCPTF